MQKATVCCNISNNRAMFCGHANHKQCYKVKKNSMAQSLVAEGPSSSKMSTRSATNGATTAMEDTPFQGYTGFFWLLHYYYNHAMAIKQ